jgi:hypothetical protein
MRYILPSILIILILSGCNSDRSTATESKLEIKEPKLSEIKSSNTEFSQAIKSIKKYLIKLNVPVDSMYYVGIDSTHKNKWEFRLIYYDNYKIQAKSDAEKKRIDSLEKAGVTEYYFNFIPPTGNWGGYDRTIVYSTSKQEIIADLVDQ